MMLGICLIYRTVLGLLLSVGYRRVSAIMVFCVAGVLVFLVQSIIMLGPDKNTLYWIVYFIKNLVIGGLLGLAWADFLHPNPVSNIQRTAVQEST